MSEKSRKLSEKVEAAAGGAVAAYVVAKAVKDARDQRRADRLAAAQAKEQARAAQRAQARPETPPAREMTDEERNEYRTAKARLSSVKTYMSQYLNRHDSLRKLLPRDGLYHSPWAYHHRPSYASLHLDQSEYDEPGSRNKYKSGMEQLAAEGKGPLSDALAKSRRENAGSPWGTLLSGSDFTGTPDSVKDAASAKGERTRLIGVLEAVEGMGFDSRDMAFARWDDRKENANYAVVPYDVRNVLHHTASEGLGEAMELAEEPGFMIRYQGTRTEELSVSIRAVDIAGLRAEMGEETIPQAPDPKVLAAQEYRGPSVLPSTPVNV